MKGKRSDGKTPDERMKQAIKAAKTRKKNQAEAYKKIKVIRTKMEEEGERVLLVIHPTLRDEFQRSKIAAVAYGAGVRYRLQEKLRGEQ